MDLVPDHNNTVEIKVLLSVFLFADGMIRSRISTTKLGIRIRIRNTV
jgi:hypothetical protein